MTDMTFSARVGQKVRKYRISEIGREAIIMLVMPGQEFDIADLGPDDRAILTVGISVDGKGSNVNVHLPAAFLEEIDGN